ncbi:MAG: ABC transporter ATP-binding protein [Paracoccaceae bacterium]
MSFILEVNNLNVHFDQEDGISKAVSNISFNISTGETVALVGESGSGKSVSALSTVRLLPQSAVVSGSIKFEGTDLIKAQEKLLQRVRGNDISFIFQEPMTSLNPLHTLEKQILESLSLHQNLKGKVAIERVLELLKKVGIEKPETRLKSYPHELSGGQRQRVMIAMALANNPKLLIADEPTTALDVTIQAQILELLAELKVTEKLSLLFITHDLAVVRKIADRVYVMKEGVIVEAGCTGELFNSPNHAYTKTLLEASSVGLPKPINNGAKEVITTENLRIWFPITKGLLRRSIGHIKAVNSASFSIKEGETLGVVGESGSGKTTLALAIMKLIESTGKVKFLDTDVHSARGNKLRSLRSNMQIIFQDPYGSLSPRMSVYDIISEGLSVHQPDLSFQTKKKLVSEILFEVGLEPAIMNRYPHEFSGGQRQRIAIARTMILKPKFVVLDEPTSALDMTVQVQIVSLLKDLQNKYKLAYLFISHDLKVVRAMSHKIAVMKEGNIVEFGENREIFSNPQNSYTKALLSAALQV